MWRKDQPKDCSQVWVKQENHPKGGWWSERCKNIKEIYSDFDKESYECSVCGYHYSLYYEDMA